MSVTASAPGKLYLAGEYAILDPNAIAVLFGVDRYIHCSITSAESGVLHTSHADKPITWHWEDSQVVSSDYDTFDLIFHAMEVIGRLTAQYPTFEIKLTTELEDNGQKYGLGSSAAVTIAVIKALLKYLKYDASPFFVFKLACLVHDETSHDGSFGDLAASAFGGCIAFHNFDHQWLKTGHSLTGCELEQWLLQDWELLQIIPLALPTDWQIAVAWTGHPASTTDLIQQELTPSGEDIAHAYQQLLDTSIDTLTDLITGIEADDYDLVSRAIVQNADSLTHYTDTVQKAYWTTEAKHAVSIAQQYTRAVKISGAGGGDCVVALLPSANTKASLIDVWKSNDIIVLPINIARSDTLDDKP